MNTYQIAIFASGSGSNAENIIHYFRQDKNISVSLIVCNNPVAFVIKRAEKHDIPVVVINDSELYNRDYIIGILNKYQINFIVLAGFLRLLPAFLIDAFRDRIINIHPALLPKFGGKGMYGMNVHRAVLDSNEKISGITIHYVNEEYDSGDIIAQYTCEVFPVSDTPEKLAERIHELEYKYYPTVIKQLLTKKYNH